MTEPLAEPAAPPIEETTTTKTEYVILYAQTAGSKNWNESGRAHGHGAENAIRNYLKGATDPSGTYIAVPARSWQPLTPKFETQTRLKFS